MSKKCSNCGKILEEHEKVCLECGTLVEEHSIEVQPSVDTQNEELVQNNNIPVEKSKNNRIIDWIQKNIIVVCLTILILIGAVVFFNQNPLNGTWAAENKDNFSGIVKIKGSKVNLTLQDEFDDLVISGKINKEASKEYSIDLSETKIKGTFLNFFDENETENAFYEELRLEFKESGILTNKEINSFIKAIHKDGKNLKIDLNFSKFSKGAIGELWGMMLGSSSKVRIEKESRNKILVILQDSQIELVRQ